MKSIADNLEKVSRRIQKATNASERTLDEVQLLAVTKKRSAEEIREIHKLGQKLVGENYLSEALDKIEQLKDLHELEWHFIGPIQSNKTRPIAETFDWVQSLDRPKIAQRLSDQRPENLPPLNILIQVNVDNEPSKSGVTLDELHELVELVSTLPNLVLRGLMAIPDPHQSDAELAESFARMRERYAELAESMVSVDTLSMGMSGDMESAIANGSTMIRIGTALFGARD